MSWSIRRVLGGTPVSATAAAEGIGAQDRLLPTGRLEAFSDGVFAIAITLLVIELHVPTGSEALVKGLEHEWPRYLGYFVSFAFIGGVWIAHSTMTCHHRRRRDAPVRVEPQPPRGHCLQPDGARRRRLVRPQLDPC